MRKCIVVIVCVLIIACASILINSGQQKRTVAEIDSKLREVYIDGNERVICVELDRI